MKGSKAFKVLLPGIAAIWFLTGCGNTPHSYRFFTENDSYHPVERPDANYTSGILFMAAPAKKFDKDESEVIKALNPFQKDEFTFFPITVEYGVGQTFYTPDDIAVDSLDALDRNERVLREDRPYAGLLFLQGAIHNHYSNGFDRSDDVRRSVFGKIGFSGNGSLAEEVHTGVHKSRELIIPVGWDLQVGQEVMFTVGLEQRNRLLTLGQEKLLGADVVSNVKASFGTIYTGLEGGLTLRVGLNLPRQVQENSITEQVVDVIDPEDVIDSETENDSQTEESNPGSSWHFYLFLGHQSRLVLRDFSLDGRFFENDIHTVERELVVNELQYGGQLRFATNWVIQALFAHRDKQFKSQRKEHSFGQYMIMYQRPFEL